MSEMLCVWGVLPSLKRGVQNCTFLGVCPVVSSPVLVSDTAVRNVCAVVAYRETTVNLP